MTRLLAKGVRKALVVIALIGLPTAALAQGKPRTEAKEFCAAVAPPPPEFTGWDKPSDLAAARRTADLPKAQLVPGQAIAAAFAPVDEVDYRVPPQKADGPPVYGGLYALKIVTAGTYRVTADAAPWIDLFAGQEATPVRSVGHGHGPPCTGLGKYVDFPLQPGDYLVQFSESLKPRTEIMVARLPD